jgi:hypothetical protein
LSEQSLRQFFAGLLLMLAVHELMNRPLHRHLPRRAGFYR